MRTYATGCLAAWLMLSSAQSFALSLSEMYTYTDERGVTHITNAPNDARYVPMQQAIARPAAPSRRIRYSRSQVMTVRSPAHFSSRYDHHVQQAARQYQLDADLIHAVIANESGYNPHARSPKGAMGLMQLMPEAARRYGARKPYDPGQNIRAGAHYLRDLLLRYDNDLELALAAYNAGAGAVDRYGGAIPPYPETLNYVPQVVDYYNARSSR